MLKRFENLGTALSRNESKMVVGGNCYNELIEEDETVLCIVCTNDSDCAANKQCRSSPSCTYEPKVCAKIWYC